MEQITAAELWEKTKTILEKYDYDGAVREFSTKAAIGIELPVKNAIENFRAKLLAKGSLDSVMRDEISGYLACPFGERVSKLLKELGYETSEDDSILIKIIENSSSRDDAAKMIEEQDKSGQGKSITNIFKFDELRNDIIQEQTKNKCKELNELVKCQGTIKNGASYLFNENPTGRISAWYFVFEFPLEKLSDLPKRFHDFDKNKIGISSESLDKAVTEPLTSYSVDLRSSLSKIDLDKLADYANYLGHILNAMNKEFGGRLLEAYITDKKINEFVALDLFSSRIENSYIYLSSDVWKGKTEKVLIHRTNNGYLMKNSILMNGYGCSTIESILNE